MLFHLIVALPQDRNALGQDPSGQFLGGLLILSLDGFQQLSVKKGRFFACLDVTEPEPPAADNPLRDMPNVLLTPHIAGTARNGKRRIALHICEETERFLSGERMRTEIDRAALAKMA